MRDFAMYQPVEERRPLDRRATEPFISPDGHQEYSSERTIWRMDYRELRLEQLNGLNRTACRGVDFAAAASTIFRRKKHSRYFDSRRKVCSRCCCSGVRLFLIRTSSVI